MRFAQANRKVDLVNQCGLIPTRNGSYKMRNGYLGTSYNIPSKVGRFSEPLRRSYTHIVIRGDIMPIASPKMQQFLEEVSNNTENTKLEFSKHPMMHITYPRRVTKERCLNAKLNSEQNQYFFNKSFLNDKGQSYSPKPPSNCESESPRNKNKSPRNRNKNRLSNRKNSDAHINDFSEHFDPRRRISLHSIIERENTHISRNPNDYIFFSENSRNNRFGYFYNESNNDQEEFDNHFNEGDTNDESDEGQILFRDNSSTAAFIGNSDNELDNINEEEEEISYTNNDKIYTSENEIENVSNHNDFDEEENKNEIENISNHNDFDEKENKNEIGNISNHNDFDEKENKNEIGNISNHNDFDEEENKNEIENISNHNDFDEEENKNEIGNISNNNDFDEKENKNEIENSSNNNDFDEKEDKNECINDKPNTKNEE